MKRLTKVETCPRCDRNAIPNNHDPGLYPGALSRADNETEICSQCGAEEGLREFVHAQEHKCRTYRGDPCVVLEGPDQWPLEEPFVHTKELPVYD